MKLWIKPKLSNSLPIIITWNECPNGSKHGEYKVMRDDGIVLMNFHYKFGELHGKYYSRTKNYIYTDLFESISGVTECEYKNDKIHNVYTFRDTKNKLILYAEYSEGVLHGKFVEYWPSSLIKRDLMYKYGLLHGQCTYYGQYGNIQRSIKYENGEIHGEKVTYNKNGKVSKRELFEHGIFIKEIYDWV
jgi:antitoxin component YwqK of YwqJK toxin-antitoxin module